jgi:hypothetical protein
MLIDFKPQQQDTSLLAILALIGGDSGPRCTRIDRGIYQITHFNGDSEMDYEWRFGSAGRNHRDRFEADYPSFAAGDFNAYGVCDSYQQVLEQCPEIVASERGFVMFITELSKASQPDEGGWRWHKWGPYIGTQEPQCEYLHDEPVIERVFTFHIYEVLNKESIK